MKQTTTVLVCSLFVALAWRLYTTTCEMRRSPQAGPALEGRVKVPPDQQPAMHKAAANGDLERLTQLIAAGADVNGQSASGESPLHWAATGEVVSLLVGHGADLSSTGQAGQGPLSSACLRMRPSAVQRLLELGCEVEEQDAIFGSTPLIWVCGSLANQADPLRTDSERVSIIRMLKAAGADVHAANHDGDTATSITRRYEAESIIRVLEE